jgi:phenylpropionate dioxygenase-like ring-hydroxylating dioxygenase large terminal subunit
VAVREAMGMIWVYTAWGTEVDAPLPLPEAAKMPEIQTAILYEDWDTHWTRAMENMLDTPHLPFVHRKTIGADMARRMTPETKLSQRMVDTPTGFEVWMRLDEDKEESRLDWARPNGMVLYILDQPKRRMRMHVWCVPLEQDRTRLIVAASYDFGAFTPIVVLGAPFNRRVIFEDRAVVESSSPKEIPPPSGELNVPTDRVTLRFRTWYHREIAPKLRQAA